MSVEKYSGRLFPVEVGQILSVAGKINENPERFEVNLMSGNGQGNHSGDIQLHLSVRFVTENAVVRNTLRNGAKFWDQNEERQENLIQHNVLNPFKRGSDFRIDIFVDQKAYFITIDGKPFCTYNHRLPISNIKLFTISKDVDTIYQVNQTNAQLKPWPAVNVNTFEAFVPKPFIPGNVVVITAVPRGSECGNFSVCFYDGSNRLRTHFHLHAYIAQKTVSVTSHDESNQWHQGTTACPQPYPFNINQAFKLAIAITKCDFQVAAYGQKIISWPFKGCSDKILSSMSGIVLISDNGLNLNVKSVDHNNLDQCCNGFENLSKL